jgi:endonuclease/exonuclease/phosphatase family metal-dependent hydrolase
VEIDVGGNALQVITTHLGTSPRERNDQISALVGPDWLKDPRCQGAVVLCGDFNFAPGSAPHRLVCQSLRDAQLVLKEHHPRRTWFSPFPLARIDHVFVNEFVQVRRIDVPRTRLSRIASDHLPLVVDLDVMASTPAVPSEGVEAKLVVQASRLQVP